LATINNFWYRESPNIVQCSFKYVACEYW